jgi:glutathione S-transferase
MSSSGTSRANDFLLGADYSVADIGLYAYTHVAGDAGIELADYPRSKRGCGESRAAGVHERPRAVPDSRCGRRSAHG